MAKPAVSQPSLIPPPQRGERMVAPPRGLLVRFIRESNDLTQRELASLMLLSQQHISAIEQGTRTLTYKHAYALALLVGIDRAGDLFAALTTKTTLPLLSHPT